MLFIFYVFELQPISVHNLYNLALLWLFIYLAWFWMSASRDSNSGRPEVQRQYMSVRFISADNQGQLWHFPL